MQPFALTNIHQRILQVLQIVFGKVVLVSSLAVDWPFSVGLRLYIGFAQAVDYDVGVNVACAVFTIGVGTDQSLMPRKIGLCIFHADGLRPLTSQVVVSVVFRIVANNVVVAFDFIVSVVLVILLIQQFAWRILRRYEYTGALVMGRRKKIDVNTTSIRTLPEDKWIIAENAHEAIVTKDEYYQAQKAIRNVTPIQYKVGDDFALKGKICCGNCKRQLRHEKQYGEMVFCCGYKRAAGKFSKCYGGYYREYSVNAKVARAIKTVFYALDVVNQGMQEKQSITVRCVDIEGLEKQAEAIRVEQIKLYESYADGVLLRDAYIEKKKALSEKLAALQGSIRTEKEEQECADELDEEIRALTKQASEKTYIGGLTKECVDAFVSMVYLYDDQTMKIEFNCEDVIRRALEKYGT